jgi:hypothetical protein
MKFEIDPVHRDGIFWYFWDKTYTNKIGMFKTELQARLKLVQYCQENLSIDEIYCPRNELENMK